MSSSGEIKRLTEIAPPDISVITNINPVHLQFFKNLKEIALAKKEILDGTKKGGIAILNGDDPLIKNIEKDFKGEKIHFGINPSSTIRATGIEFKGFSGISFSLVYGNEKRKILFKPLSISYLYDLLCALAIAFALNIKLKDIADIIPELRPAPMRGEMIRIKPDIVVINDSYNSNPKALEIALKDYSHLPAKRKIAVLGDMLELGKDSPNFHFQAGEKVANYGYNWLITVGKESKKMIEGALKRGMNHSQLIHFNNSKEAAEYLSNFLKEGDLVLVKGSRGIKMEEIINKLKNKKTGE
jgi:UDP-N-acetylmuramoyl-tripeptide--D-alanyl-D-alanine ligase